MNVVGKITALALLLFISVAYGGVSTDETTARNLSLNETYAKAWNCKGNALFNLRRYDESLECKEIIKEGEGPKPVIRPPKWLR
jgi:hypothetical protein